ncbi:MAG: hypothetical protein WA160_08400 [Pseudobdellovibrio sp.]
MDDIFIKNKWIKNIVITALVTSFVTVGHTEDKKVPTSAEKESSTMSMMNRHEHMMKAHQLAADCLKSGKSEEECQGEFHTMCKEAGGTGNCGFRMKGMRK